MNKCGIISDLFVMSIDLNDKENKENNFDPIADNYNLNYQMENNNTESLVMAEAIIQGNDLKTIVTEVKFKDQLRNKGFGEAFNNEYLLSSLETLYLLIVTK